MTVSATGPTFTSGTSKTFAETTAGTFSVTATGDGPFTYTKTGTLPSGVTLATDGTLSGTPGYGTAGSYPITITATDANTTTATQAFTVTVTATGPVFTSGATTPFAEAHAGNFAVTANGDAPITYSKTGALPTGVTLASNGTLSGTPAFGTAGSYPITITATDANTKTATQAFTLTVTATGPSITSAAAATFTAASANTFAVTANGDTPITFTETGPLPSGVGLATSGTLSGTPAAGTQGTYPITITATDAHSSTATQAFTLTVGNNPPTTSVIAPSNNATVSGTATTLDALATAQQSGATISKVQFVLTGGTFNKTVLGTGSATIYGYVYSWNTVGVPNGSYTVQSLATDSAGNTAYSAGITVTVSNAPPTTSVIAPVEQCDREWDRDDAGRSGHGPAVGHHHQQGPVRADRGDVQQDGARDGFAPPSTGTCTRGTPSACRTGPTPCRASPPTAPGTPPTAPGSRSRSATTRRRRR